jgi:hypothetical protein
VDECAEEWPESELDENTTPFDIIAFIKERSEATPQDLGFDVDENDNNEASHDAENNSWSVLKFIDSSRDDLNITLEFDQAET